MIVVPTALAVYVFGVGGVLVLIPAVILWLWVLSAYIRAEVEEEGR